MSKKEIMNCVKEGCKSYSLGYNLVIDAAIVAIGIKTRNARLIATGTIATIGTMAYTWDDAIKPFVNDVKEVIENR